MKGRIAMATTTDYDARRTREADETSPDSLTELNQDQFGGIDIDVDEGAGSFDLPAADLPEDEFIMKVVPKQSDEFTCASCFLVFHRHRLARTCSGGAQICIECA